MKLALVVGTVVSSQKDAELEGLTFLVVRDLDSQFAPTGGTVVAVDAVGAGVGETVMYASGSSSRLTSATKNKPVDATIMAIVDMVEVGGDVRYHKDR